MSTTDRPTPTQGATSEQQDDGGPSYLRCAAMIATSALVMFGLKHTNTYALAHVEFSETRTYMALMMGGAMAIVMLTRPPTTPSPS